VHRILFYDMMLVGKNMNVIKEVKMKIFSKFYMKDLRDANFIIGMDIKRFQTNMKLLFN
jgi:hypothetical protein